MSVSAWPSPQNAPSSAARRAARSRDDATSVVTAAMWSGSVAWRSPSSAATTSTTRTDPPPERCAIRSSSPNIGPTLPLLQVVRNKIRAVSHDHTHEPAGPDALRQRGRRITRQRRLVWEARVAEPDTHLSADALVDRVRAQLPTVDPSTVYRTLDLLVREGLVRRIDL